MMPIDVTVHKWGNSLGIRIPKDVVKEEDLKPNKEIRILILKDDKTFRKTFGKFKECFTKPTQEIKDELRKELYDD